MQIVHTQKFIRMSPRKLRPVADMVRRANPDVALELLPHTGKRAALPLEKAIRGAVANAKDRKVTGELVIKELQIQEGPRLKRGRAASRGRWLPYKRRMSHIKVILETVETAQKEVKAAPKKTGTKKEAPQKAAVKKTVKAAGKKAVKKGTKK